MRDTEARVSANQKDDVPHVKAMSTSSNKQAKQVKPVRRKKRRVVMTYLGSVYADANQVDYFVPEKLHPVGRCVWACCSRKLNDEDDHVGQHDDRYEQVKVTVM